MPGGARRERVRVAPVLEELGYMWFEEPLQRTDLEGYRSLRAKLDIAVAGGEGAQSAADIQTLLAARAVDMRNSSSGRNTVGSTHPFYRGELR